MKNLIFLVAYVIGFSFWSEVTAFPQNNSLGIFENESDIGKITQEGKAFYNPISEEYLITTPVSEFAPNSDPIHYLWKKINGDFIIHAEFEAAENNNDLVGTVGCMIRNSLDTDTGYLNASVDKTGYPSIAFRGPSDVKSTERHSIVKNANVIQVERDDKTFIVRMAKFGDPFVTERVAYLSLPEDLYIGLFVGSDEGSKAKKAVFHNIRITIPVPKNMTVFRTDIGSNLETLDIQTFRRKIFLIDSNSVHSPIWKNDGKTIIYGKQGMLFCFDSAKKTTQLLNTGKVKNTSNDHVLSCDGKKLAFCVPSLKMGGPVIYVVGTGGGNPKLIHKKGPSYPHGWSPDGKFLLFAGSRNGRYTVFKIPARGGKEINITNTPGNNDSPEYSPEGKYIYFNSNRTGAMCVWRMKADGTEPEMLTTGEFHDWFPHVSPDGKWVVFLSYSKEDASPSGHPSYKNVYLRLMPTSGGSPKIIAYVYGGQGTINSPCWSPDSKKIAFASYSDTELAGLK
jgi:regulation of enolase protein 1 (concanavalin A-like superfamily)